tara:strand:+ start:11 stop:232 length:222 start_codon:yes stop_codon:yes gene_type:complete
VDFKKNRFVKAEIIIVTGIKNSIISEFGLYILYDEITKDIEWPIVKKVTIQNNFFQLLNEYTTEIETRNSKWS